MSKRKQRPPTYYTVDIVPSTYATLLSLSRESHRPIPDLLQMAVSVFAASTRQLHIMHPDDSRSKQNDFNIQLKHVKQHAARLNRSSHNSKPLASAIRKILQPHIDTDNNRGENN